MKKVLFLTLVFIAIVVVAKSQPAQRPSVEQRVQTLMVEVKKQMTLPGEKLTQVENIYTEYYKEMEQVRQNSQGTFNREQMTQRREKLSEKLLTVLTQAEHDKLVEIVASQRRQGRPQ